jgi:prepilin-type N-terminal cleavage/methylation domain-containing protein
MNKNGFSLAEMLISIVVASVLILMVGILATAAGTSFNRVNKQQQIFNDISYGFKLVQNKVRVSTGISKVAKPASTPWRSDKLVIGSAGFGIYRNTRNGGINYRDFAYIPNLAVETTQEHILSIRDDGDLDSNLTMTIIGCDCTHNTSTTYSCSLPSCSGTPKSVTLVVAGKDIVSTISSSNDIKFSVDTTISKRNN